MLNDQGNANWIQQLINSVQSRVAGVHGTNLVVSVLGLASVVGALGFAYSLAMLHAKDAEGAATLWFAGSLGSR